MNRIELEDRKSALPGTSSAFIAVLLTAIAACSGYGTPHRTTQSATIGAGGGEIVGATGSALEGLTLTIPAGALTGDTLVEIGPSAAGGMSLPGTAVRAGPQLSIGPPGTQLAVPARLTLPFDADAVAANDRFDDEVAVWVGNGDHAEQRSAEESTASSVTVEISSLDAVAVGVNPPAPLDVVRFDLHPNPQFERCLARFPGDAQRAPSVEVTLVRGSQTDALFLRGSNIRSGLAFDLFTVEHTSLAADATVDPAFTGFGLATYRSDLEASDDGEVRATLRTTLLDDAFSFDPTVRLPPTGPFNLGFWFDDPAAAVECGFDASHPTPFNGEHAAGPLAMISAPGAKALGPLCTNPDTSTSPPTCSR